MNQNPIRKVLLTLQHHNVRSLLMGGQACVFYGAAEFSRDTDIALLAEPENLARLESAMLALRAHVVAVPSIDIDYLIRGHALHFRCEHPEASGMRLDVMSVMRGLPEFSSLWERRTTVETEPGESYDLLALPDLVTAKKTQRDKDWPMIRRLIEADYQRYWEFPTEDQVGFWLREARTPALLREISQRFSDILARMINERELLNRLPYISDQDLELLLLNEERAERLKDQLYWIPLRKELEQLRLARSRNSDK